MGTLFVIATPIGNLDDLSRRAERLLVECPLIVAENTRRTSILTRRLGGQGRLVSLNEHNISARLPEILAALADHDVALVSDAGTPAISDPGYQLVDRARSEGHTVLTVPGPSAVIAALAIAGVRATPFAFLGYAPRTGGERNRWLTEWLGRPIALVLFESPNRIAATLAAISRLEPERVVVICRELTKVHEQSVKATAREIEGMLGDGRILARGEFVVVVEAAVSASPLADPDAVIRMALAEGKSASEAAKEAALQSGQPKSDLYQLALRIKESQSD